MDLLSNEDIRKIIKSLGYTTAKSWYLKEYSDELLGYLGEHLTLTVETDTGAVLKFFVKCLPRFEPVKAKYLEKTRFFEKEYAMLNLLFEKFLEGLQKWRPKVFLAKKNVFVFEDVVQIGYTIIRDRDTLTLEEVKASVATMARFHSQSYIYEEKRSQELGRPYRIWEDYSDYLHEPDTVNWRNVGMNAAIDFLKVHSKYKDCPIFSQNIESTVQKLFNESLCLMKPHSIYRNVVVHRDLWKNNILFQKDANGVLNSLFVDFQTVIYCSPMLDFSSFLYFNTRRNFREYHLDGLLDLYHKVMSKELKASNIEVTNIMNRETLTNCYKDSLTFAMVQSALIVPIFLINKETTKIIFESAESVNKFYEISRSENFLKLAKTDKHYQNHVLELLDEIVERYIC